VTTKKRLQWFRCYPEKFLTALAGMSALKQHVYLIVCLRIYEKRGAISDSVSAIAKRCGYDRVCHVQRAIAQLVEEGKLFRTEAGLMNPFAENEITERKSSPVRTQEITQENQRKLSLSAESENKSSRVRTSKITQENQRFFSLDIERKKVSKKEVSKQERRRAPRHPMPENWQPDERGIQYARDSGFLDEQGIRYASDSVLLDEKIRQMIRACRNYYLRRGDLIAGPVGLSATWRNWCDNELKFQQRGNGHGRFQKPQLADTVRELVDEARRLEDQAGIVRPSDALRSH
jgi:hypothetical protein